MYDSPVDAGRFVSPSVNRSRGRDECSAVQRRSASGRPGRPRRDGAVSGGRRVGSGVGPPGGRGGALGDRGARRPGRGPRGRGLGKGRTDGRPGLRDNGRILPGRVRGCPGTARGPVRELRRPPPRALLLGVRAEGRRAHPAGLAHDQRGPGGGLRARPPRAPHPAEIPLPARAPYQGVPQRAAQALHPPVPALPVLDLRAVCRHCLHHDGGLRARPGPSGGRAAQPTGHGGDGRPRVRHDGDVEIGRLPLRRPGGGSRKNWRRTPPPSPSSSSTTPRRIDGPSRCSAPRSWRPSAIPESSSGT